MNIDEQLAHYRTAYDILKGVMLVTVLILCFVILIMSVVVYEARKTVELNNQRYNEMRKAYDVQAIYFNNMKARIEALNEVQKNE